MIVRDGVEGCQCHAVSTLDWNGQQKIQIKHVHSPRRGRVIKLFGVKSWAQMILLHSLHNLLATHYQYIINGSETINNIK